MSLPPEALSLPIKIAFKTGVSGSGFLLDYESTKLFLVTAKHVLYKEFDKNELILFGESITISVKDKDLAKIEPIKLEINLNEVKIKTSSIADICVIPLGDLIKDRNQTTGTVNFYKGVKLSGSFHFVTVPNRSLIVFEEIELSSDVFVSGYPVSLQHPKVDFDQPLLRKGIVAGKNNKNKTIILDCPVYPGNSGGLAMQKIDNNFKVIGIVTEFIPFLEIMRSMSFGYQNSNLENSGYSILIPAGHILDLVKPNNEIQN